MAWWEVYIAKFNTVYKISEILDLMSPVFFSSDFRRLFRDYKFIYKLNADFVNIFHAKISFTSIGL